ncbi:MAG: glycoside hydrolase family 15 protein [Acidimicrobiia bacterium]
MSDTPIGDHALLSDCHSALLVDRSGSAVWWCVPRFDSASVFGRLLDDEAGHFSITPRDVRGVRRRYLEGTLVLETTFQCATGTLVLTEALAMASGVRGHDLGEKSPHRLVRNARCDAGQVDVEIEYVPRTEYGLTTPVLTLVEGGVIAVGGPVTLVLSTDAALEIDDGGRATGVATLSADDELAFAVEHGSSWEPVATVLDPAVIRSTIGDTTEAWRSWEADHQRYEGPFAEEVVLSGRVLQGLTYVPTGAIVAAPTTSLPEAVGGSRNWDYRYSWVRDASFTLDALWVAACPDEERDFFGFLTTAASSVHHRDQIQATFGVGGERDLTERELSWLEGWRGSRPVRVGNGAWKQSQHDVYGALLAAAYRLKDLVDFGDEGRRRMLVTLADLAAKVWDQPDQGIWEMRDEPRHHLYSKLMCWVALDRALELSGDLQAEDRVDGWREQRDAIRVAILDKGWNQSMGAFTQSFGSTALDASALVIPIVGFLAPDDPKVTATIDVIERQLSVPSGLLMRYRTPDGLEGDEGAFLLCTFWLAHAHALAGNLARAREVFRTASSFANDLGLLAEEVDTVGDDLIGNFPQAFSHIGLINAAWAIAEAERAAGTGRSDDSAD